MIHYIILLTLPLLVFSLPSPDLIGPRTRPSPFLIRSRTEARDIDYWNTPRPDNFLSKRSNVHSIEYFTNPSPSFKARSPRQVSSPASPLINPEQQTKRATSGQWENMSGSGLYHPAVTSWGPGRQDVYYTHRDRKCRHKYYRGGSNPWIPEWDDLGGSLDSAPSCCSRRSGYMHMFCKGTDYQIWHRPYSGGGWGSWQPMGGNCKHYPSSCSWGGRHASVYTSSSDNQLWGIRYDENRGWGSWQNMGGSLAGAPKSVSWGEGHTGVVVRGTDGQAWATQMMNGNTWGSWTNLGGSLDSEPSAVAWSGNMTVAVGGTDGAVWMRTYTNSTGNWGNWMNMGGDVRPGTAPDVVAWGNQMEVYYTGRDGAMYRKKATNGQWTASWENMGGSITTKPSGLAWDNGKVDVYGMASEGSIRRCY
ncbi:Putative protein of unknown function [Podospora comata]|uniref:PLL-like beta propeller domain-containing protein n=1 Tax=Podospora comata TaxID=48703 RepID=A0ABY6SBT2_PODCO|nr:Putative protein of unknown function [Podospora comata]